ncbi:MAG TPA: transcriptional regulator [Cytophagales bacterium]|nr:transcriptional regulator [Cytophagales bacterium]HAA17968.1 transcriptional regulator [Cytophagales bacterium]HAP62016.1 transcriptional regulator [Cytophagales bacterium]
MRRDVFQAIADPVRRDIIGLLAHERMNLNSVAENFSISRPAVSKHIKILTECGVVEITQTGRERYCTLQPKAFTEVKDWLDQYRELWEQKLDSFESYLEELKKERDDNTMG